MTVMNSHHHGASNAPPNPVTDNHDGDLNHPPSQPTYVYENPTTKIQFLAKIEHTRNRSDTTHLHIKAFLIQLLLKHQNVEPTFQFLPHDAALMAGVITKASKILNTKDDMKTYIKEMKDHEDRNNTKTYTISFFLKFASSVTLGSMKKDDGLFI
jgi:hypothetical protein